MPQWLDSYILICYNMVYVMLTQYLSSYMVSLTVVCWPGHNSLGLPNTQTINQNLQTIVIRFTKNLKSRKNYHILA